MKRFTMVAVAMMVIGLFASKAAAADLPTFSSIQVGPRDVDRQNFSVQDGVGENNRYDALLKALATTGSGTLDGQAGSSSNGHRWIGLKKGGGLNLKSIRRTNEIPGSTYSYELIFKKAPTAIELEQIGTALEQFHKTGNVKTQSTAKLDRNNPTKIPLIVSLQD